METTTTETDYQAQRRDETDYECRVRADLARNEAAKAKQDAEMLSRVSRNNPHPRKHHLGQHSVERQPLVPVCGRLLRQASQNAIW
jgi:hypothetical protein